MNLTKDIDRMHQAEMKGRVKEKLFSRVKSRFWTTILLIIVFIMLLIVNIKSFDNTLNMIPVYLFGLAIALMIVLLIVDYAKLKKARKSF